MLFLILLSFERKMMKNKSWGLAVLLVLVFAQVVSAGGITMELVANTTSDAYGDYIFTDIPNGNYQLVALKYTPAMGGKWLMTKSDVVIENGTDIVNANLTLGFADPGAQDPILSLLERASISGKTLSTPMGGPAQNYSDVPVALLKQASEQPVPPVLSLPAAAFSANVTSRDAPLNVAFTDESTNATSW